MAASSLEEAKVKSLPSIAFYIADFITEEEEQMLLNKVSVHFL
jgi:alkylated DNA repair protein alkB family protein 6